MVEGTLVLWQEDALIISDAELMSLTFNAGTLIYLADKEVRMLRFCGQDHYFQNGFCRQCSLFSATPRFQQQTCLPCTELLAQPITAYYRSVANQVCGEQKSSDFILTGKS